MALVFTALSHVTTDPAAEPFLIERSPFTQRWQGRTPEADLTIFWVVNPWGADRSAIRPPNGKSLCDLHASIHLGTSLGPRDHVALLSVPRGLRTSLAPLLAGVLRQRMAETLQTPPFPGLTMES